MGNFEFKMPDGDNLHLPMNSEDVTTDGTGDVLNPDIPCSRITSGGAHTVTLANGKVKGFLKHILLLVDGGTVTLTPASFADGTSLTFADALDYAVLRWNGSAWELVGGAGLAIVA